MNSHLQDRDYPARSWKNYEYIDTSQYLMYMRFTYAIDEYFILAQVVGLSV
jgi:hypothetical protein